MLDRIDNRYLLQLREECLALQDEDIPQDTSRENRIDKVITMLTNQPTSVPQMADEALEAVLLLMPSDLPIPVINSEIQKLITAPLPKDKRLVHLSGTVTARTALAARKGAEPANDVPKTKRAVDEFRAELDNWDDCQHGK